MSVETKAITATSKASDAINKSVTGLAKIVTELGNLAQDHEGLLEQIAEGQQHLDSIHKQTDIAEREAAAELALRIKENQEQVLNQLLEANGLARISIEELNKLREDLFKAMADHQEEIDKAVAIAVNKAKSNAEKDKTELESKHKVDVAEKDADIKAQTREIEFLNKQVTGLEKTIDEERKARIQIAQAEASKEGVTVNTNQK